MAKSPAHKLGQIIGNVVEDAIEPLLRKFAAKQNLYFDKKGQRSARKGKKVALEDKYGNKHDLDYVLERGGSDSIIGNPAAFVEIAWRRYTKHSRNKAQEIQGAILPLRETYKYSSPFIGAVLAGVFTEGSIIQLKSRGFHVLYFSYQNVIAAFNVVGVDVFYTESTTEKELQKKVNSWLSLSKQKQQRVSSELLKQNKQGVKTFMKELEATIKRQIVEVRVIPLHGDSITLDTIDEAIQTINTYVESSGPKPIVKYEVLVKYNNGDRVEGCFSSKEAAINFLQRNFSS